MEYRIERVINNNVVCSVNGKGEEIILRGKGIGFQKKPGMEVDASLVEGIFTLEKSQTKNKLVQLLEDIPEIYIEITSQIVDHAKETLGKSLNENIYVTLTDHIHFAIERKQKHLEYVNPLLWEIKSFYTGEYQVGLWALDLIHKRLGQRLKEDEAGFIALHIVNAQLGIQMDHMYRVTEMIGGILKIVEEYYGRHFDTDSMDYERFITHLKFFGQRLFKNKTYGQEDPGFHKMIKERYAKDYGCAMRIRLYIKKNYQKEIGTEEITFLTVHLRRLSSSEV
ncbi:MAG TPA: PRD domain-containing protein [Candidatus Scybalocola faecavium]|nr:PRD domain-containing protein [Candidatus Scybalocola faecavium]